MGINVYQKGDLVRVSATFTDVNDSLIDPDTVVINITSPDGVTTSVDYASSPSVLIRESTGSYYYQADADQVGDWHYTWVSTGIGQATQIGQFAVEPLPY